MINKFNSFTIRPAKNGFIVEPERRAGEMLDTTDVYVFNNFDDFVVWLKSRIVSPSTLDQ